MNFAADELRREALVDEGLDVVAERDGGDEADQQGDHGVRDALAQLVEVLEERHPPFERIELITEGR